MVESTWTRNTDNMIRIRITIRAQSIQPPCANNGPIKISLVSIVQFKFTLHDRRHEMRGGPFFILRPRRDAEYEVEIWNSISQHPTWKNTTYKLRLRSDMPVFGFARVISRLFSSRLGKNVFTTGNRDVLLLQSWLGVERDIHHSSRHIFLLFHSFLFLVKKTLYVRKVAIVSTQPSRLVFAFQKTVSSPLYVTKWAK